MAKIFHSYFMQREFEQLYRVLLPSLNECGACGITKCYVCKKFDVSCSPCFFRRCVECVKFFKIQVETSRIIFAIFCTICSGYILRLDNILGTFLLPSDLTLEIAALSFRRTLLRIELVEKRKKIYYLLGNRKYKFYYDPI